MNYIVIAYSPNWVAGTIWRVRVGYPRKFLDPSSERNIVACAIDAFTEGRTLHLPDE